MYYILRIYNGIHVSCFCIEPSILFQEQNDRSILLLLCNASWYKFTELPLTLPLAWYNSTHMIVKEDTMDHIFKRCFLMICIASLLQIVARQVQNAPPFINYKHIMLKVRHRCLKFLIVLLILLFANNKCVPEIH